MAMTFSDKRIASSMWFTTGCYTSKSVEAHWVLKNKISDCHGGDYGDSDGDVKKNMFSENNGYADFPIVSIT